MRNAIWLALCLSVGCGKGGSAEPAPESKAEAITAEPAAEDSVPQPSEARVVLDAAKAKAYVGYKKLDVDLQLQNMKNLGAISAKIDAKKEHGFKDSQEMMNDHLEAGKYVTEQQAANRKQVGLSEGEVKALSEIESGVLLRISPLQTQVASQIPDMEKALASLPPEARAETENNVKELKARHESVMSMKEERDKYGDAIVDAMIAETPLFGAEQKRLFDAIAARQH